MSKRIIIFTGKGGVGKSSVAAAHALKSAAQGKNTLLVSTDMAHNLSDIFETKLGSGITNVRPDLDLYEIDPQSVMENDFEDIMRYLSNLLAEKDMAGLADIGMIPGMEELFSLLKISQMYDSGTYDRIIVDCAPTGETLSLLKFPSCCPGIWRNFSRSERSESGYYPRYPGSSSGWKCPTNTR